MAEIYQTAAPLQLVVSLISADGQFLPCDNSSGNDL